MLRDVWPLNSGVFLSHQPETNITLRKAPELATPIKISFFAKPGANVELCSSRAGIGALGSVLLQGGQLAGIGSDFRRWMAILTV